jgi:serine protease Do
MTISNQKVAASVPRQPAHLPDFVPLAKQFAPSFVHISTLYAPTARDLTSGKKPTLLYRRLRVRQGLGSGFIISRSGHVLTNYHVVERADKIVVKRADRRELDASVVGRNARTDIALFKVAAPAALTPAALGDSSLLEGGDWVVALDLKELSPQALSAPKRAAWRRTSTTMCRSSRV